MQTGVLTEQSAEELTLEDVDDSVQRLVQLLVVLAQTLRHTALVLVSVVEFGPVLLQELQGSLSIYNTETNSHPAVTVRLQNSPNVMERLVNLTQ